MVKNPSPSQNHKTLQLYLSQTDLGSYPNSGKDQLGTLWQSL